MIVWSLLVIAFCKVALERNGFNLGPIVHAILINVYLAKGFYWETGYFCTIDVTMDRAGYYLCWGSLCFVAVSLALVTLQNQLYALNFYRLSSPSTRILWWLILVE